MLWMSSCLFLFLADEVVTIGDLLALCIASDNTITHIIFLSFELLLCVSLSHVALWDRGIYLCLFVDSQVFYTLTSWVTVG
jgi:hypothetical protein